jgi:hypothetical protein
VRSPLGTGSSRKKCPLQVVHEGPRHHLRSLARVSSPRSSPLRVNSRYSRTTVRVCQDRFLPEGSRPQRFLVKSGDVVLIYGDSQAITLQLRHEVPTEVDLAATSFKAAVALTPGDALLSAGELLTAAAAQLKSKA